MRFKLRALILIPLFFCPAFMSLALAFDLLAQRQRHIGNEIFFFAACYTLILLVFWTAKHQSSENKLSYIRTAKKGGLLGIAFGIQLLIPVQCYEIVRRWRYFEGSVSLWEIASKLSGDILLWLAVSTLVFCMIGSATGFSISLIYESYKKQLALLG